MNVVEFTTTYSPTGDVLALILVSLLFFIFRSMSTHNNENFKRVNWILATAMGAAIFNMTFNHVFASTHHSDVWLNFIRTIYHINVLVFLHLFLVYLFGIMNIKDAFADKLSYISLWIFSILAFFDVISPITHFGLFIKDGKWYTSTMNPFWIAIICYYVIMIAAFVKFRHRFLRKIRIALFHTEIICGLLFLYEFYVSTTKYTTFLLLLPVIVLMFMLHTTSYDINNGSLGEAAFIDFIHNHKGYYKFYLFTFESYSNRRAYNNRGYFCSFWSDYVKNAEAFFIDNNTYILMTKDEHDIESDNEFLHDAVAEFCRRGLVCAGIMFYQNLPVKYDDIKFNIEYSLKKITYGHSYILNAEDGRQITKELAVLNEMKDIAEKADYFDERVLVYVQPVKNVHTQQFDTAEALMRLHIPEYGFIQPGLFIPLAEKYKLIHSLSLIIFNKVCHEVKLLDDEGYHLKRISVNFALEEFKNVNFIDEIEKIIIWSGVPNNKVAIEVTESENDEDFEAIKSMVDKLKDLSICLYLDDFGTGYSNFDRIFGLKLNVIKFDRSFLLMAEENENSKVLITHFSDAFNKLGYKVLYEGVETDEQEQLCMDAFADYLQGFKFSPPIPIRELRNFLSKKEDAIEDI